MRKSKLILKVAAMFLFLSAIVISVNAQQGPGQRCYMNAGKGYCENFIPDLSDKQKDDIAALRTSHLELMNKSRAEIGVLSAELKQLEIADNADQKAIDAKIDELSATRTKMMKIATKTKITAPIRRVTLNTYCRPSGS